MPSLTTCLLLWGLLGPLAAYGFTKADAWFDRRAAVRAAMEDVARKCTERIEKIGKDINDAADKRVADAVKAAEQVGPTPAVGSPELQRLCDDDANCRGQR